MQYLIHYKKEFVITIGVFLTVAVVLLWVIFSLVRNEFGYEQLIALIGTVFEMAGWWTNIPTSEANAKNTAIMRLEKAEHNAEVLADIDIYDDDEEEDDEEVNDDDSE